jgi:hypothetical protein
MTNYEKFYQPEFIESYVRGLSSPEDTKMMQNLLQTNADLQNEVNFQKDLLAVIADSRKKDLKLLLQNTPVPTYQPFYQKPFVQMAAVALVGIVIILTTILLQSPIEQPANTKILKEKKETQEVVVPKVEEKTTTPSPQKISAPKPEVRKENTQQLNKENRDKNAPFIKEIHYQYDGGNVLQLFGDFRYELLEKIDVGAGEKTYIYIQNQFYELIPTSTDEVRNLKENLVTDKEQIKLLTERLLRK